MLGHLRHEIGHYYWPLLVGQQNHTEAFRALFGDERADYAQAHEEHRRQARSPVWDDYVSGYATTHPSEDRAETFAHYLHIRATLQTANAFGIRVTGASIPTPALRTPDANTAAFDSILGE